MKRLADVQEDFEVYLQFDSFEREPLMQLRGADLRRIRQDALEKLNRYNISTNLVVTLKKGLNDHEIGKTIDFALQQPCVRGVTFQPIQDAGRLEEFQPRHRPPDPDRSPPQNPRANQSLPPRRRNPRPLPSRLAGHGLCLKAKRKSHPLTSMIPPEVLINGAANTILYEQDPPSATTSSNSSPPTTPRAAAPALSANYSAASPIWIPEASDGDHYQPDVGTAALEAVQRCTVEDRLVSLPLLSYENIFRIIIMQFIDAHSFDVRSVKKTCVHIVHPDGRLIPFDTYNLFYRDGLEKTRLTPLRQNAELALAAI